MTLARLLVLASLLLTATCGTHLDGSADAGPDAVLDPGQDPGTDPGGPDSTVSPCTDDADCQHLPGVGPCRPARCLGGAGVCVIDDLDEGAPCDPGNPCLVGATCLSGECVGTERVVRRLDEGGCDDDDPCTVDACDPASGACTHAGGNDGATCSDRSPCTTDDACQAGACVGTPVVCADDGNPCTSVACNPDTGECRLSLLAGAACDDGDPCTRDDACVAGAVCQGAPLVCDDGSPCTTDACDPLAGACAYVPDDDLPCDDGNPCTHDDACTAGTCAGQGQSCDDQNPCTSDTCITGGDGCAHTPLNGAACDDGDACTGPDACVAGGCAPGPLLSQCCQSDDECDDGEACTIEACVAHACTSTPITCAVTDPCAWARCLEGTCEGGILPPDGHLELLHAGFEVAEDVPGLTIQAGQVKQGTVQAGQRALAVTTNGEVLRLDDVFVPAGTAVLQGYLRSATCTGTGLLVAVDGVPHTLGCGDPTRWSPFQVPIVSDVDAVHTLEVLWWGGASVWLDELSVVLVGRLGCARGLDVTPLGAPSDLLAAALIVDADRRPMVAVARADDGTGTGVLVATPEPAGWTFTPMVTGTVITGTVTDVFFQAVARAGGGLVAAWSSKQATVRVAVAPGAGELAAVVGLVGSGPFRYWPDVVELSDGRLFAGFSSSKSTNGRYQPLAFTWNPATGGTGAAWLPSTTDAAARNHVAVTQLSTGQRAIVWTRDDQLRAAIANPDGSVAKADFAAHVGAIAGAGRVRAAALGDGRFVVVWEQTGQGADLAASLIDPDGTVLVDAFPVPFDASGDERNPDLAATVDDRFVIVWEDQPAGGDARLVARVFQGYGEGGAETVIATGPLVRAPRVTSRPPYLVELAWIAGNDVHERSWGFDCSEGTTRCQDGVPQVCVGATYARLGGTCSGPACAPSPCP